MKFQVLRNVPAEELVARLPPKYRHIPLPRLPKGTKVTVLVFRSHRDEKTDGVVISATVAQALERLGEAGGQQIVAAGGEFTLESQALLRERGAMIVTLGDFGWTDERYKSIKSS